MNKELKTGVPRQMRIGFDGCIYLRYKFLRLFHNKYVAQYGKWKNVTEIYMKPNKEANNIVKLLLEGIKFSTTIKEKYWKMKMKDLKKHGFFWEFKKDSKHWRSRLDKGIITKGVFLIGNKPKNVIILEIQKIKTYAIPKRYSHGLIKTKECYAIKCKLRTRRRKIIET